MLHELLESLWAMDERGLALRRMALEGLAPLVRLDAGGGPGSAEVIDNRRMALEGLAPLVRLDAGGGPGSAVVIDNEGILARRERLLGEMLAADPQLGGLLSQAASGLNGEPDSSPIRVVPIFGMLVQHPSWLTAYGLATSCDQVQMACRRMVADPQVQAIVLRIYSPGGNVHGVKVLADYLLQARKEKLIWAHADSVANSGAYWIGASCGRFSASPMGECGSIGAFTVHRSYEEADKKMGIKNTIIRAGKMKASSTEWEDLTPEAQAHMQARIDAAYAEFVSGVAKGRSVPIEEVRSGMGQGAAVDVKAALDMKMIDDVASFPDTLTKLVRELRANGSGKGGTGASSSSEVMEQDLDLLRWAAEFGVLDRIMTQPLTEGGERS